MASEQITRAEYLASLGRHLEVLEMLSYPEFADDSDATRMRVFALLNTDQIKEAHNEADRLVAMEPNSPLSFLARSYSWEGLDRPWESLRDARTAVGFAPSLPILRSRLATCLARSGQLNQAHEEVGWVLTQEPDEPDHWVLLGRVYYHLHRFTEAEEALYESLRLEPQNTEAKVLLAGVQAEMAGRKDDSIDTLIDVLRENPTEASIRQLLLDIAFPTRLSKEAFVLVAGIAILLGGAVAVPLALLYGTFVAYRYRSLRPTLRMLVWTEPSTRRRMQLAIAAWSLGVLGAVASGVYLLSLR